MNAYTARSQAKIQPRDLAAVNRMSRARVRCPVVLLVAFLSLAPLAIPAARVGATLNPLDVTTTVTVGPVLTGAACTGGKPGILLVTGEEFTPGGEVKVMLYEPAKVNPTVIRSIRASLSIYGLNGSTDPAFGFQRGGFVGIAVGPWCDEKVMIRAFDRQTANWTNQLHVLSWE
jgi:hypothetical protein